MPRQAFGGPFSAAALSICLILGSWVGAAAQEAPAVSAPNGKITFEAGALDLPSTAFMGRVAGTLTLPLGAQFGLQADLTLTAASRFAAGGALHLFTRDPQSHLIGGALGAVRTPGALVVAAGPEAEFYFDRWTLEAWGGLAYARRARGPDRVAPLIMADVATYPIDNLRLSLGLTYVDSYAALHGGVEYLIENAGLPLALTADARLGADGAVLATVGLKAFIGGPEKSLIRRHREDDPADRGTALYAALGGGTLAPLAAPAAVPRAPDGPPAGAGGGDDDPPAGPDGGGDPPAGPDGGDGDPPAGPGDDEPPPCGNPGEVAQLIGGIWTCAPAP